MTDRIFERLKWVEIGSLALGLLALIGGSELEWAWLYTLSMLAFGFGMSLSGMGAFSTRRVRVLEYFREGDPYLGPAAVPWGFAVFLLGLSLLGLGVLRVFGLDMQFIDYLSARPGMGLVLSALLLGGIGLGMVLGPPDWNTTPFQTVMHLPLRLLGILIITAAAACLGLGGYDLIAPGAFDNLIQSIF